MNVDFAVDENGLTADGYHVLDPISKKALYMANSIAFAMTSLFLLIILHLVSEYCFDYIVPAETILAISWIVAALYLFISPSVFYNRYRYRMDDDKLEVRRGVMTIRHEMVPIERIHQVDVSRGPINRHYGLADVTVTTAGGTVTLQCLREDDAETIATKLNEVVIRILAQRS